MTAVDARTTFESVPGAGSILMRQVVLPRLVGASIMLAGIGTSAALPSERATQVLQSAQQTTSGAKLDTVERSGAAIAELRRLSGLTWDQLARLFSVRSEEYFGADLPGRRAGLWRECRW